MTIDKVPLVILKESSFRSGISKHYKLQNQETNSSYIGICDVLQKCIPYTNRVWDKHSRKSSYAQLPSSIKQNRIRDKYQAAIWGRSINLSLSLSLVFRNFHAGVAEICHSPEIRFVSIKDNQNSRPGKLNCFFALYSRKLANRSPDPYIELHAYIHSPNRCKQSAHRNCVDCPELVSLTIMARIHSPVRV